MGEEGIEFSSSAMTDQFDFLKLVAVVGRQQEITWLQMSNPLQLHRPQSSISGPKQTLCPRPTTLVLKPLLYILLRRLGLQSAIKSLVQTRYMRPEVGTITCMMRDRFIPKLHGGVSMAEKSSSKFHQIPDALWERIDLVIPIYKSSCKGGRPRLPMRNVVEGILYVLATGCQWKAMPKQFGSGSALHAYFQEWVERGVFEELWELALCEYDDLKGIDWKWQSMDGAMTKSPLGGEKNREKPDRSRQAGGQAARR